MSDSTLDLREQIARIDRALDESEKLRAEAVKLRHEGRTYERERFTMALTSGAAILGAGAVLGGLFVKLAGG